MNFIGRLNKKGDKITYYYDYGRGPGQRPSTGIFLYTKPKNQAERNHNKESLAILDVKKGERILEQQAVGSAYIPTHKFKTNFIDYYREYVKENTREGNRHLNNSFTQFRLFLNKDFISPIDITESFCKRFRQFLLDKFTGETPLNYYARYKWVLKAATKEKYFTSNPTEDIHSKSNPSTRLKNNLEVEDYLALLATPCINEEVREAFIFCCYTGLRWVDVKKMVWADIKEGILTTRLIQAKTGQPVILTLHPIALKILGKQREKHGATCVTVFKLPTANGANKILDLWVTAAGLDKYITWSCARLSFSILLQDERVDNATVAYLLGHTTTKQVERIYKRHRPKNQMAAITVLPAPTLNSNHCLLYPGFEIRKGLSS